MAEPDYLARLRDVESLPTPAPEDAAADARMDAGEREFEAARRRLDARLRAVCAIVREAEAAGARDLAAVLVRAGALLDATIEELCGDDEYYDWLPSFAHREGELVDDLNGLGLSPFAVHGLFAIMRNYGGPAQNLAIEDVPGYQQPWSTTPRPHSKASRLARFWAGTPPFSPTPAHPAASAIYSALCETTSAGICNPGRLRLAAGGGALALVQGGGWTDRSAVLSHWDLAGGAALADLRDIAVGLEGMVYHSAVEDARRLVWVADEARVKSFAWPARDPEAGRWDQPAALPVHTLQAPCGGPLHATRDHLFRAGKGFVASWKIDALYTHGPDGEDLMGGYMEGHGSDDEEEENEPEWSKGSAATVRIKLDDAALEPTHWHPHPSTAGHMLCVSDPGESSSYTVHVVDLGSGKIVDRYLGHGGEVQDISTSAADPNVFVTAANDGYARLFDVRHRLPVLTLNVSKSSDGCDAAVLCHPNGIPSIFTGTDKTEHITLWDVRTKTACYELATGNNAVRSMAWDANHNTLYAATECNYIDRVGNHHDYRRAKIPEDQRRGYVAADEDEDVTDDEADSDYSDNGGERAWPKKAFHGEGYWGHTFDAAKHTIFKYHFKGDADIDVVPEYGEAII
ncbi:hypothetical protein HWV62_15779 [Athelia sp. TMB]|nr:hypothetical protein HWV62_15779 [Athelia sp. TMB]